MDHETVVVEEKILGKKTSLKDDRNVGTGEGVTRLLMENLL